MKARLKKSLYTAVISAATVFICPTIGFSQDATPTPPPAAAGSQNAIPELPETRVEAAPQVPAAEPEMDEAPPTPQEPETPPPPAPDVAPAGPLAGTYYSSPFAAPPTVDGYAANSAVTGTLMNTPLIETPQSIQVVPEQLINDTQLIDLSQTFRFSSGVLNTDGFGGLSQDTLIRGFNSSFNKRWNGFNDQLFRVIYDLADVDRVEILKGPSSVLYGNNEVGGLVNIVTKKPLDERYQDVHLMTGPWGLARAQIDHNTPLTEDGEILSRTNFMLQNSDDYTNFVFDDRLVFNQSLSFLLTEDTVFTAEVSFFNRNSVPYTGVVPVDGNLRAVPSSTFLNDPTDRNTLAVTRIGMWLDHQFNDEWAMRVGTYGFISRLTVDIHQFLSLPPAGTTAWPQIRFIGTDNSNAGGALAYLVGETELAGHDNTLVVGTEYNFIDNRITRQVSNPFFQNIQDPVYVGNVPVVPFPGAFGDSYTINNAIGAFFMDNFAITDWLDFQAGVRYDGNNNIYHIYSSGFNTKLSRSDSAWTPRGAFLVNWIDERLTSWYSYSQSFDANVIEAATVLDNGAPIEPEFGQQHEVGMKLASEDQRFLLTTAIYQIDKSNILVPTGIPFVNEQIGGARSRGFEVDAFGQITERLSIVANYAYTDARVTVTGDPTQLDQRLAFVPYNLANFWGRYNLIDREYCNRHCEKSPEVFGVGYGMRWVGNRTISTGSTEPLTPSYVTVDMGLFYQRGPLYANLYLENLGDVYYFSAGNVGGYTPGNPFGGRLTVGLTF